MTNFKLKSPHKLDDVPNLAYIGKKMLRRCFNGHRFVEYLGNKQRVSMPTLRAAYTKIKSIELVFIISFNFF